LSTSLTLAGPTRLSKCNIYWLGIILLPYRSL